MSQKEISEELRKSIEIVQGLLADIQYGNVLITVQDGKIVQIDKTEKYRIRN